MARSNAAAIYVPPAAIEQFEKLLKYISDLPKIMEESKTVSPGITAFEILEPLSEKLKIPYEDLGDIFFALENLRLMSEDFGSFADAFIRITAGVKPELAKNLKLNETTISEALSKYRQDNSVAITVKAQKLTYLHERVFRDAEIITDIRPVFDSSGRDVLEAVISHMLVVNSSTPGRSERLHFALDAGDVLKLRRTCDRAIEKAKALKSALDKSDLKWKIQVLRGQDDGIP